MYGRHLLREGGVLAENLLPLKVSCDGMDETILLQDVQLAEEARGDFLPAAGVVKLCRNRARLVDELDEDRFGHHLRSM